MFTTAQKSDSSQISITGVRALIIIGLLLFKSQSLAEIKETLIKYKIIDENCSDDTLRIDINTIRAIGCEIPRPSNSTGNKYVILKHPFSLKIAPKELEALRKAYNLMCKNTNLRTLLDYHYLFEKIALHLCDEETKEALLGISILKYYNLEFLNELIEDCKSRNIVSLVYKKPNTARISSREVVALSLEYKNDKIYFYGHDIEKDGPIILNLRRLRSIIARRKLDKDIKLKVTKIKFLLKNIQQDDLDVNEDIIDKTDAGYIIEGTYHNDFIATQRMLSFGARCIVMEPTEFKDKIVELIKEMRKKYDS